MGWESSSDTLNEVILKFPTKDKAIEYAKKNGIRFRVYEPNKKKFIIKSYADNFLKSYLCGEVIFKIKNGFIGLTAVVFLFFYY